MSRRRKRELPPPLHPGIAPERMDKFTGYVEPVPDPDRARRFTWEEADIRVLKPGEVAKPTVLKVVDENGIVIATTDGICACGHTLTEHQLGAANRRPCEMSGCDCTVWQQATPTLPQ